MLSMMLSIFHHTRMHPAGDGIAAHHDHLDDDSCMEVTALKGIGAQSMG
jgi:metal-responsive CopG/Arc/MetJ family transcriptional regulator